jgi:hypothetical protein
VDYYKTDVLLVIVVRDDGGSNGDNDYFEEVYLSFSSVKFSFSAVTFVAFALSIGIITSFSLEMIIAFL